VIGRIGKVLRLQTESGSKTAGFSVFAGNDSFHMVRCVEQHAGLGGGNFQGPSASRVVGDCRDGKLPAFVVQHPILIVALGQA